MLSRAAGVFSFSFSPRLVSAVMAGVMATVMAGGLASPPSAAAADPPEPREPHELQVTTERLVIFKDGYALVVKRGTATTDADGRVFTDEVPDAAVLGSFWALPDEGRLVSMVAGWEERTEAIEKDVPATQHVEILQANAGREAKVELDDKAILSGTIKTVLTQPTTGGLDTHLREELGLSEWPGLDADGEMRPATITGVSGSLFVLATAKADVLVPIAKIRTLTVPNMKTTLTRTVESKVRTKRLTFQFDEPDAKRELTLMYFRPGLRWIPTYRIDLDPDEKAGQAAMALQGEILNEAEDFGAAPIDLVVGVPNFRFREVVSPLVLEATLRQALREAAPQIMGQQISNNAFSNALFTQRAGEFRRQGRAAAEEGAGEIELPEELTAGSTQDLFVYHLPELALKKGERAAVPIFTGRSSYEDAYTWDLRLTRSDNATAPSGAGLNSPLELSQNQVWHQVVLPNRTKVPWTTGAAMITEGQLPLAQELLTYTSVGDEVRVPVTVAVDVRGSVSEKETSRDLNALNWDGYPYAKIERQATLRLTNRKQEIIETEITFRFGGKATEASLEGQITLDAYDAADWKNYRGAPAVNNSSTVIWRLTLKPGETAEPTVTYHYYTRQ